MVRKRVFWNALYLQYDQAYVTVEDSRSEELSTHAHCETLASELRAAGFQVKDSEALLQSLRTEALG